MLKCYLFSSYSRIYLLVWSPERLLKIAKKHKEVPQGHFFNSNLF